MNCRLTRWIGVPILSLVTAATSPAQENPAKRLSSIVGVAVEEYAKSVDESGKVVARDEFEETTAYLVDAKQVAARLSGYEAVRARATLDSIAAAVAARKPPTTVRQLHQQFLALLGTAGALDLPTAPLDTAAGRALYAGDTASPVIMALLDSALDFARQGKISEAGDRAFDAYIAFEPLETPARAKNPELVATMERHFAEFKGALSRNDIISAKNSRDAIAQGLPSVVDLTKQPSTNWQAFLQSFLIILREGFEAILVLGAVVTFLIKTGHRERLRSIWSGAALGVIASLATAVVLRTLLGAMPASRPLVEAITMLLAVAVLFSVSYWLISKVEAAKWQKFIREKVSAALEHGGGKALTAVAFLAVFREGAETALFYQALFNSGPNVGVPIAFGMLAGFAALAVIFTLVYRYGVRIPMRPFFAVTSILLYYMAFVFMGKGIQELQEANLVPITVVPGAPQIDAMGIYPSVETLIGQAILVALLIFATVKTFWPTHKQEGGSAQA